MSGFMLISVSFPGIEATFGFCRQVVLAACVGDRRRGLGDFLWLFDSEG
jgi:hypothetical protein